MNRLYSNEIVFRGHPDKVCDQISDALLDAYLEQDEHSRCGIETVGGKGIIFITGEVTSKANVDVEAVTRRVLNEAGYDSTYRIFSNLGKQSPDITLGTNDKVRGAGDNGMMFGFACDETDRLLPKAMVILQEFSRSYDRIRQRDSRFKSDGKAQITGLYDEDMRLLAVKTFTICYQNTEEERDVTDRILMEIADWTCSRYGVEVDEYLINPTGKFSIGGFEADAGLTGRKIVVDSYQSFASVGGGAFSGKDLTKVDRSGAYKARELAVRMLRKYGLRWCEVQLSYAIGKENPLAIYIDSDQGIINPDKSLYKECKVGRMVREYRKKKIRFADKARFGHFD